MRNKTEFQRRHIEARFISDTLTQIYDEFIDKNLKKKLTAKQLIQQRKVLYKKIIEHEMLLTKTYKLTAV